MSSSVITPPDYRQPLSFFDKIVANLVDSEINAFSGATAGVISALAVCPLDVAKTKLQAQGGVLALQKHYANIKSSPSTRAFDHFKQSSSSSSSSSPSSYSSSTFPAPSKTTISASQSLSNSKSTPISTSPASATHTPPSSFIQKIPKDYLIPSITQKYKGIFGTLSTIYREEGIPGLYRGVVPITIGYLPTWAIYFVIYEEVKNKTSVSLSQYPFFSHMISALTAGASSTLATNPIWVVKTRLMTQSPTHLKYRGTLDAFHKMFVEEGIFSFYAGLGPALLGLLHVAVQFPLYEELKKVFNVNDDIPKLHQCPQILAASVIAKICASSITYPHEVIRTRIQIQPNITDETTNATANNTKQNRALSNKTSIGHDINNNKIKNAFKRRNTALMKYHGILQTTKTIFREEGWQAFYSGLGTNMVRTVPASALTLLTYEVIASYLKSRRSFIRQRLDSFTT